MNNGRCPYYLLLFIMSSTDALAQVHLSGLVEFLKRGGTYDDVVDYARYKKIMANDGKSFRYDFAGEWLTSDSLKMFFDIFKEKVQKYHFYAIAIG